MSSHLTSCDASAAQAAKDGARTTHPALVLTTCILASSLAFVDGSVVNVGLPAIRAALQAQTDGLQWVINAYLLPLSALLLLGGAAGDRFGRRLMLVAGTGLFGIASILCALAPDLGWLLAGRTVQGIGAAMLMPNSLAILGASFSGEARGKAIGMWAAAGAAVGAVGPVLGGWLIDTVGWRAIFLINLPLAAGAIALALVFVREEKRAADAPPLDWIGGVLATAALGALTWGLTIGSGHGGWDSGAIIAVTAGVLLLAGFIWIEHLRGEKAMMPLALFGSGSFVGLTALTLLLYGALGGLLVLVPYLLIQTAHYSAMMAGAALLPFPIVIAATGPLMGGIAGRTGPRVPLIVGPFVVALGFLLLLRVGVAANYWTDTLPALLVIAFGMAGAVAPLTTAVLGSVDARHTGSASGLNSAVARTGGLIATALLGSVLAAQGEALVTQFHIAAIACAIAALGASVSAFVLIRNPKE